MALKTAQLDPFALAGAGVVAGATSVILKSFTAIDGVTPLTMTDFGAIGYGTLEPGNGTFEEQISFTGVTQNANGTATLSGVSTVLFLSPYTESSGLEKSHAGSTTFVISNTSGFYNQIPFKQNNETITGTWTFENTPITPPEISFASTTVAGVVQEATNAQTLARTQTGDTGADLFLSPLNQASTLLSDYVLDTGAADAYAIAPTPAITAYVTGQTFTFKAIHANTTTSTVAVSGLAAKTIKLPNGQDLSANAIIIGQVVQVEYDGTNFQLLSVPGNFTGNSPDVQTFLSSGTWTKPLALSGNEIVLIRAWGGGAGGGSCSGTGISSAGGGGGGSYVTRTMLASDLGATVAVTVGTAAAANTAGNDTTFGAHVTAYGGGRGITAGSNQSSGGGGGAGSTSAGSSSTSGSPGAGGVGGGPGGSAAATGNSGFGGGGGGAGEGSGAPSTAYGGAGGGGGSPTNGVGGFDGGTSVYAGAGGGGGAYNAAGGAGGAATYGGGTGGAGGNNANGSNGTQPGGGGGGAGGDSAAHTGGLGGAGKVVVYVIRS